MNLHGLVSTAVGTVNPLVTIQLSRSNGSTTQSSGKRVPVYDAPVTLLGQVQPLETGDLRQLEGINLQGTSLKVYINGQTNGLVRVDMKGGDKIVYSGKTYLVTKVIEQWPDWVCSVITLQND